MTTPTEIVDPITGIRSSITVKEVNGEDIPGISVFTEPLVIVEAEFKPFLNPLFGIDMNQNFGFAGTPEIIHDGGDTSAWAGTAVAGIWDFADTTDPDAGSACVSLTSGNNNDNALF